MDESDSVVLMKSQEEEIVQKHDPKVEDTCEENDFEDKLRRLKLRSEPEDHEERYSRVLDRLHSLRLKNVVDIKPLSDSAVHELQLCLSQI